MSASRPSVLVGFADALAAPEVAASLLAAGHRVSALSRRRRVVALRRMRGVKLVEVTAPEDDLAACASDVATAASAHDVTMPLDDAALLVCDRGVSPDAVVTGPRGERARFALDKREQLRSASAAGFDVPEWTELGQGGTSRASRGFPLPAMLKPVLAAEEVNGRLRRLSPRVVRSLREVDEMQRAWGVSTPLILQRWVQGEGAGVFGLADDSGIHHLSAHRRIRMMNPAGSGSSACASAPVPHALSGRIARLLGGVGWDGMFMVELLRDRNTWWFMELNGRPWGSLALARRLGYEYPAWAVARRLDSEATLPRVPPFAEVQCRHLGRELVHLLFVLRGPRSYPGAWPGRAATIRALMRRNGGTCWYNSAPGMRRLFLEDAWRTVVDQTRTRGRR